MKTNMIKPSGLSANQNDIWDAVTTSPHSLNAISKRSGYSEQSIKNWMKGVYEPQQVTYNDIIEAIEVLESEQPSSINWKIKKGQLIQLKAQGLPHSQIAAQMNTSVEAINHASIRFCKAVA